MKAQLFTLVSYVPYLLIRALDGLFHALFPKSARSVMSYVYLKAAASKTYVEHNGRGMTFYTPTSVTLMRALTFADKEPETLSWIENFESDSLFVDIGANVGLYSIYACKTHDKLRCIAVEPSATNFEILVRNVIANECGQRIIPTCIALSARTSVDTLILSSLEAGGASNAFGVTYGYDGKAIDDRLSYQILGMTLTNLTGIYCMGNPNYIKIDVDGIEHLILEGAREVLMDSALKSILIEMNDDLDEQRKKCFEILESCKFRLATRTHAPMFDMNEACGRTYNYIWVR